MAELKVEVVEINDVKEHPNADRMELAYVGGYQVCVQKELYEAGDLAVYFPVDSVLNNELESMIFGPDSKVKLNKHRVRAIKLRGALSEGMLVPISTVFKYLSMHHPLKTFNMVKGAELTKRLGVEKYQPPVKPSNPAGPGSQKHAMIHNNPYFKKYTDINHFKKYVGAFDEGEEIIISEKIHGTNFRAGWVPYKPRTFFQKLKNIFWKSQEWEFVYGSHNVQLQNKGQKNAFADNVYGRIVKQKDLKNKIPKGHVWYGEIFGDGIQKNYNYSMPPGCVDVAFFDVMDSTTGEYMDWYDVVYEVETVGENVVPYTGGKFVLKDVLALAQWDDPSFVDGRTKPVEGWVIRSLIESKFYGGRRVLKLITDAYALAKDNTDWH